MKSFVEDDASIQLLFISALFYRGNASLDDDEWSHVQYFQQKANILVSKHILSKYHMLQNSKLQAEIARFAEMLEHFNKISISMIQPIKSSSSQPVMNTDLLSHINAQQPQLDANTYPGPSFSQGDNPHTLEDICQHFDIHEFLSFNFPEETSDIFTTNSFHPS